MILRVIYTESLGIKLMTANLIILANLKQERARAREKPKVNTLYQLGSNLSLLFLYDRTTGFLVDSDM